MKTPKKYTPLIPIPLNTYSAKVNGAISYILSNYRNVLDLEEAAQLEGVSHQYLSTLFKKVTGYSFVSYYNSYRLNKAGWLLENTTMESRDIALSCGFDSPSYFVLLFRKTIKKTPLEYRREVLAEKAKNQSTV